MNKPSLGDRLRYLFDNTLARGPVAQIAWLGLVSVAVIAAAASCVTLAGVAPNDGPRLAFHEAFWLSLMRTLDPGTMGGDSGWGFRVAMLAVTFGGIFVISTLIGVITSGIEGKLTDLRKGRTRIIESGHTVILGWSEQVFPIVGELILANANQPSATIAILADQDKVEMEDALRERFPARGPTRLVCRRGSPMEMGDLDMVNLAASRSVIVLSPESESPDADVVKILMAITNSPTRRPEPYHIVAEIRRPANAEVARMVAREEVEIVLVGDLISRMIAQTCRQSGLSVVYNDLLDFSGDEIYFKEEPGLVGQTIGEALAQYDDSCVIGLQPAGGAPQLHPPHATRIGPGDKIIVISEDDDTIQLTGRPAPPAAESAMRSAAPHPPQPEQTLVLGWNWRAASVLGELDSYVPAGSRVTVVARPPHTEESIRRAAGPLTGQTLSVEIADTTERPVLDRLEVQTFDHVVVLAYDDVNQQQADAATLMTLLHLRDIAERRGRDLSIVSEMLDVRNRQLADVTRADDFIVSDRIVSLMLAQISENKALNAVFADLFDPEGAEIYLKPAVDYVAPDTSVDFYTILEAARRRGETAIGYRLAAWSGQAGRGYGVVLNPRKPDPIVLGEADRVIVLAEN
jgi:Trk K+ transport system NAD-binding subunit